MPKVDSKGELTWNPSVGLYHKPAADQRESYGGIIGALQDIQIQEGLVTKAYPHNFAGIIAAIQDIAIGASEAPVYPGPNPGGGVIDPITGDWVQQQPVREGDLWFDTRQGRLFCYVNDEWVQTNGADGLAHITDDATAPIVEAIPAPGQFWYDRGHNSLYIHDGSYVNSSGDFVNPGDPDASPLWRLVNVDPDTLVQTTATLPLSGTGPKSVIDGTTAGQVIEFPNLESFNTQRDYNWWAFDSLLLLEQAIVEKSEVVVGENPPPVPHEGLLWYDTESLDLSIYYEDGDSGQWVPVSTPYTYDADLDVIRYDLSEETRLRETAIQGVYTALNNLDIASNGTVQSIQQTIADVQNKVQSLEAVDYITRTEAEQEHQALEQQIAAIVIPPEPDLSPYVEKPVVDYLTSRVDSLPTASELDAVRDSIPNVSGFVTQDDINASIAGITTDYLPRTGGELTGSFIINKTDYSNPALDFSSSPANSKDAFKFQALAPSANNFSTFGITDNLWEHAWQFASDEDFCWIYNDSNKVFSITKEGPACSQLYIGDFGQNNNNGRVISNRIDVRDRLTTYQSAFEQIRQAVSSSTDYESLKAGLLTALSIV